MSNIEVLKRRDKWATPCVAKNYDAQKIKNAVRRVGCKPSIIDIENNAKNCETKEEYERFEDQLNSYTYPPPCKANFVLKQVRYVNDFLPVLLKQLPLQGPG